MSDIATLSPTAQKLLDAQVAHLIEELTGPNYPSVAAGDVANVLTIADSVTLAEAVDPADVKASVPVILESLADSDLVPELVSLVCDAVYTLPAADDYTLGATVDGDQVKALIDKVLSMRDSHEKILDHISQSPLVAKVASVFVNKLVADVLDENKKKAEKIPGVGAALAFGGFAASKMLKAGGGALDGVLGDVTSRSGEYAVKKTNAAIKETIRTAPVAQAGMEIWGLHAVEPMAALRDYISQDDLRELAAIVHGLVRDASTRPYTIEAAFAAIDSVFAQYGSRTVGSLLRDLGIDEPRLTARLITFAPQLLAAAKSNGTLEAVLRKRLAPFYESPEVARILAG